MDLARWIADDLRSVGQRLERGVVSLIPPERRGEHADDGGIAPSYVLWHLARHHDVAVAHVLGVRDETLGGWSDRVGIDGDTWRGLAEGEDHELVGQLDPEAVAGYALATLADTVEVLDGGAIVDLDVAPDTSSALAALGTPTDRFSWLYEMWEGQPAAFFWRWEAVGHAYNHLGELVSIRNRMGLSPF